MTTNDNMDETISMYEVELERDADQSTSYTVIQAIADLTGREPTELEPLWNSIDSEALDSFVAHAEKTATPYRLAFQHQGYTIEITTNGKLRIAPNEESLSTNTQP